MPLAFENGTVLILVVVIALPLAGVLFAVNAGNALREIGRGPLSIDQDIAPESSMPVSAAIRDEEIRQLVTARSYRREQRGEEALDIDAEVERLVSAAGTGPALADDRALVAEVRELAIARNERRLRQGKKPLDVDAEVARQLRELESLGQ